MSPIDHPFVRRAFAPAAVLALSGAAAVGGVAALGTTAASARQVGHRHHAVHHHASPWRVVGHVYVDDNTKGENTIAGFARHANGRLTTLSGSPFRAGGAGSGALIPSQGSIQITSNGREVLAVDAGSNEISVLRIHSDGALSRVETVASRGDSPVSITTRGSLVYVANQGPTNAGFTGFRMTAGGRLIPIPGATEMVASTAAPVEVDLNSTATRLVGDLKGANGIASYVVSRSGRLTAATGSPFMGQGAAPFGSTFTSPGRLYVANPVVMPAASTVSSFREMSGGRLMATTSTPVDNGQSASCWLISAPNGRSLYSVNTGSGTVTGYSVSPNGTVSVVDSVKIPGGAGAFNSVDPAVSPDGHYLYVTEHLTDAVAAFSLHGPAVRVIRNGMLSLPKHATPGGVAVQ